MNTTGSSEYKQTTMTSGETTTVAKNRTLGEKYANLGLSRTGMADRAVDELEYDSGRYGDTAYVFKDGSGAYEKRRDDFYPLTVEEVNEIRKSNDEGPTDEDDEE